MKNQKRDTFRESVFKRDRSYCIVPSCHKPAVDAHHIIERRLWTADNEKGGYLIDNGVSLCEEHHKLAERNVLSPHVLRLWAGITNRVLPKQLDPNRDYDKWGKILKPLKKIYLYKDAVKYPSTAFFEFSPNLLNARETNPLIDPENLVGYPVVISLKMDGSNVTITRNHIAARNGTDARHRSFDYCKSIHASICQLIPEHIQIFGEWLYAKHSIHYSDDLSLYSYLQIFGVYDQKHHIFLGWNDVEKISKKIGYPTVPVLSKQIFHDKHHLIAKVTEIAEKQIQKGQEGIVVRSIYPFHYSQFPHYLAKYVRADHVKKGVKHWKTAPIIRNEVET